MGERRRAVRRPRPSLEPVMRMRMLRLEGAVVVWWWCVWKERVEVSRCFSGLEECLRHVGQKCWPGLELFVSQLLHEFLYSCIFTSCSLLAGPWVYLTYCQLQAYRAGMITMSRPQSDFATTKAWTKRVPGRNLDDDGRERQRLIQSQRHRANAVVYLPYTNPSLPVHSPHLSSQVESTSPLATSQYRKPHGIPQRL